MPAGRTERDRFGNVTTETAWGTDGRLEDARVRIPGGWLRLEPRATNDAPWGASDRVWRIADAREHDVPLTLFAALDYARVDHIPPLADPERLPPGGGTALLNLIATLAAEQGRARLAYRGPYPTEQLFLALLECFRYVAPRDGDLPLSAFTHDVLEWEPAPHERLFTSGGATGEVYVQRRERVEKVVWQGRTYLRHDWQDVTRHAPRRLWDTPDGVVAGLWLFDAPLEDHLLLTADAARVQRLPLADDPTTAEPMDAAVVAGVVELAAAMSTPVLAPFVREAGAGIAMEWGPVARDLVAVGGGGIRVSNRLRGRVAARVAGRSPVEAASHALAGVGEIARLVGDELRRRARDRIVGLDVEAQQRLLAAAPSPVAADAAGITAAVRALLRAARTS
ncbi:MAG: hypothetical protein HY216_05365 [Candidatus Rokubacteria bacterium]|nr:hypothetical protein [Candidatus Rokubacteria bacterium]